MGKPSNNQKVENLQAEILKEKFKRVNAELTVILGREGVAFQPYLSYREGGIVPSVRLVERTKPTEPTEDANRKTETPSESDGGQPEGQSA